MLSDNDEIDPDWVASGPASAPPATNRPPISLTAALTLAAAALPVFPCGTNKRPLIKAGREFSNATTDPDRIRAMWRQAGAAAKLIGVPCGPASGFDALDVDPKNGGHLWEAEHRLRLPETRIYETPSGGRHWLWRHAHGVRNSAGRIAPGVDVRGRGGYVCWPGAGGYRLVHESYLAPWPDWLLPLVLKLAQPATKPEPSSYATPEAITERRYRAFIDREVLRVRDAAKGTRHNTRLNAALSIGGIAEAAGLSDAEAERILINAQPPETEEEAERETIRWGLAKGREKPISLPDRPWRGGRAA